MSTECLFDASCPAPYHFAHVKASWFKGLRPLSSVGRYLYRATPLLTEGLKLGLLSSLSDRPNLVTLYDRQGILTTNYNPDPNGTILISHVR